MVADPPTVDCEPSRQVYFRDSVDRDSGAAKVEVSRVARDPSPMRESFDPGHPLANADGYVTFSNVNAIIEMMDMKEAERSFSAGLRTFDQARDMFMRTLDLLRR